MVYGWVDGECDGRGGIWSVEGFLNVGLLLGKIFPIIGDLQTNPRIVL